MTRQSTEDFWGSETTLYETVMVDSWHYKLLQTYRMYSTKSEPKCSLWMIMTCPRGFTNYCICPIWWGTLRTGEAIHMGSREVHGKSLYRPLSFVMNLELL